MSAAADDPRIAAVVAFYEGLTPTSLPRLGELYAPAAYFRDPFNEVRGRPEIERIFSHMFANLEDCRFTVLDVLSDEQGAFMTWDFTFRFRRYRPGRLQTIHGASHLRFDDAGYIVYHRDYWDAAEELYGKLPLIGSLMRYLRRRAAQ